MNVLETESTTHHGLKAAVLRNPTNRAFYLAILELCLEEPRELSDLETRVSELPEFNENTQNSYRLISYLERQGGLDRLDLDQSGRVVDDSRKKGLSEDEIDDLVVSYAFVTTEEGTAVINELDPTKLTTELIENDPARASSFHTLLAYLAEQPRSYPEIESFCAKSELVLTEQHTSGVTPRASILLGKLEQSGAVCFNGRWMLTEGGRSILQQ